MNDNALGFNIESLERVIDKVIESYNQVISSSYGRFCYLINTRLSKGWYAPQGVKYVTQMAERQNTINNKIYDSYNYIFQIIVDAGKKWANTVGEYWHCSRKIPDLRQSIDVSVMMPRANDGFVGIISENMSDANAILTALSADVEYKIDEFGVFVYSEVPFLGREQAHYLHHSIHKTSNAIFDLLRENMEAFKKGIQETMETYRQTAQANAQRFSSGN